VAVSATVAHDVAESVFKNYIKKAKHGIVSLDDVTNYLKDRLKDGYTSELGISVRYALTEHPKLDFFKEGDTMFEHKYYWCAGNWLAIKGEYKSAIEGKKKLGLDSWQVSADDESYLD
jgi:hypothetical protein